MTIVGQEKILLKNGYVLRNFHFYLQFIKSNQIFLLATQLSTSTLNYCKKWVLNLWLTFSRDLAFRLLYHVESRNQDYTINRPLILGPAHDALVKHVKVEGPNGVAKNVLNVTEGFRMSQVFSVVVNRQVFMSDQSKFESSLLHTLRTQWTGTKMF